MFRELMNFKYKRSSLQALGFYIFYLIIGGLLGGIISSLIQINSSADTQTQFAVGIKIGHNVSIVYCTLLALLLVANKKLYTSPLAIILFLLSILGAYFMACLLGCICPAILSTMAPKEIQNVETEEVQKTQEKVE